MPTNIGGLDRILRFVAGLVLLALPFLTIIANPWNYVLMVLGVVMLLTAALRFCPPYALLGINTCPRQ